LAIKSSFKRKLRVYFDAAEHEVALESIEKNFSRNLSRIIKERGMSQKGLAKLLDVGESIVSGWVSGGHLPRPKHWDGLAKILRCSFEDLVRNPGSSIEQQAIAPNYDDLLELFADRAGYKLVPKKRV
jgi:transcriptional regulator with XRE-family HTH domain